MEVLQVANGLLSKQVPRIVLQRSHISSLRQNSHITGLSSTCLSASNIQLRRNISTSPPSSSAAAEAIAPTAQTSHYESPTSNQRTAQGRKLDDMSKLLKTIWTKDSPTNQPLSNLQQSKGDPRFSGDSGHMFPQETSELMRSVHDTMGGKTKQPSAQKYPELRLNPALGRTVRVDPTRGIEANQAFSTMESRCVRNKVRFDERTQKTYVRKGQVRKEMKCKRWKKLFRYSFGQVINRCTKLRRQGW